jgi:Flp pilus assembly secretin CpaC
MSISMRAALLATPIAALACAAPTRPAPEIEARAGVPLAYRADVRSRGLERVPFDASAAEARASERKVEVECSFHAIDARAFAELTGGDSPSPAAWISPRARVEPAVAALRDSGRCSVLTAPRAIVFDGAAAKVSVAEQVAYVADFEVSLAGEDLIADPVVETLQFGLSLDFRPALAADGRIALALALVLCDLQRPIAEIDARLPGVATPVKLQTPLVQRQELAAEVSLAADECAAIVVPSFTGYRLVLVTARESV